MCEDEIPDLIRAIAEESERTKIRQGGPRGRGTNVQAGSTVRGASRDARGTMKSKMRTYLQTLLVFFLLVFVDFAPVVFLRNPFTDNRSE